MLREYFSENQRCKIITNCDKLVLFDGWIWAQAYECLRSQIVILDMHIILSSTAISSTLQPLICFRAVNEIS